VFFDYTVLKKQGLIGRNLCKIPTKSFKKIPLFSRWLNFVEDSTKTSEKIDVNSNVGGVFWKTPPQTPENGC
jgi:hypothetical protein